jgi:hypothetical protein
MFLFNAVLDITIEETALGVVQLAEKLWQNLVRSWVSVKTFWIYVLEIPPLFIDKKYTS